MSKVLFFLIIVGVVVVPAKKPVWKTYSTYDTGFCGDYFYFYTDNTFYYSIGCEGNNDFLFGTWKKSKKAILLTCSDTTFNKNLFQTVTKPKVDTGSLVKIIAMDKFNRPIRNCHFNSVPRLIPSEMVAEFEEEVIKHPLLKMTFNDGDTQYVIDLVNTNENGELMVDARQIRSLMPIMYSQYNKKITHVPVLSRDKTVTIKWDLPEEAFHYPFNKFWKYSIRSSILLDSLKNPDVE